MNEELKFLRKFTKKIGEDQGRCVQRSEVFVKIQKKKNFFWKGLDLGGGGSGWGGSGWM